jgi:hypothetical protein
LRTEGKEGGGPPIWCNAELRHCGRRDRHRPHVVRPQRAMPLLQEPREWPGAQCFDDLAHAFLDTAALLFVQRFRTGFRNL